MNGLELKLARVRAGLTQWELANLSQVNPARISEMETNKRPVIQAVIDTLERLSRGPPSV